MLLKSLALTLAIAASLPAATLSIQPSAIAGSDGVPFPVNVVLSGIVADAIFAYQFDVQFTADRLVLSDRQEGSATAASPFFSSGDLDNSQGMMTNIAGVIGPAVGNTESAILLTFTPTGAGESTIELRNVVLIDGNLNDVPVSFEGATVSIASADVLPGPVPEPGTAALACAGALMFVVLRGRAAEQ